MAIKYSLTMRRVDVANPDVKKVHATAQANEVLSITDLANHISEHNSLFDRSTVVGVTMKLVDCIKEQLLLGNHVSLGELGTFRVSLSSHGADTAKDFTAANIKRVRVNWYAPRNLKNLLDESTFEQVSSRDEQAKALKREKLGIDAAMGGQPSDDDNPSGGGGNVDGE